MFIDYVTLMLINMTAGLLILGIFVLKALNDDNQTSWSPGFLIAGLIAIICGLHMAFTWPLPGSFNMAFGELSILFGVLFLGTSLATAKGWKLNALTYYAMIAGLVSVLIGFRMIDLGLSKMPAISGAGFILTGLGGICAYPVYRYRTVIWSRVFGSIVMFTAATIWAFIGYMAYWGHMKTLMEWAPK